MATKTYEEVVKEDAPEIYLRLAEASGTTAADATRFGRDFTHTGNPTLDQSGPSGIGGSAVSYDGSGDATLYSVNMPITGDPFTMEYWAKAPVSNANDSAFEIADSTIDFKYCFCRLQIDGSSNLKIQIGINDNSTSSFPAPILADSLKGEWIHIAIQIVSATERNVYVNGILVFTDTTSVSVVPYNRISVGALAARINQVFYPGEIAEPALYNYKLSPERIRIHHAVGLGRVDTDRYAYAVLKEGPGLYAELGGASGNATDDSGFERDLTVEGAPTREQTSPLSETGGADATLFDGTDDAFSLAGDDLDITGYPVVVQGYLKAPASLANNTSYCRVMFGDDGTEDNYFGIDLTTDGSGNLQARGLLETGGTADHITGSPVLSADQFYHVTLRCVSATERYLEVNGVKVGSDTTSRAFGSNIDDVVIGRDLASSANFYAGTIGQVAIYGRDIGGSAVRNQYAKAKQYLKNDHRTHTLSKCPLAYFRMGESSGTSAANETEFSAAGTYAGTGPTLGETGALVDDADTAVQFNGTDDQMTAPLPSVSQYPITVEALVKLPSSIGASTSYIRVGLTDASGTHKMVAGLKTDSNTKLQAHLAEVGTSTGSIDNSCGGAVGNYHHLIAEFVSDTERTIWLNGVELETDTTSVSITLANLDTICVGVEDLGTDAWYAGYADEVVIYQRQLSTDEKRDQYLSGLGYSSNPKNGDGEDAYLQTVLGDAPTILLPLNEASGSTASDASRWGRDATYSGGVTLGLSGPNSALKAMEADATDGKFQYDMADHGDPTGGDYPMTQEIWARAPDSLSASKVYITYGVMDTGGGSQYSTLYILPDGSGNCYVRWAWDSSSVESLDQNSSTGIAAQNSKWLHIVAVAASSTDRRVYVNGRQVASSTSARNWMSGLDAVRCNQYPSNTYPDGGIMCMAAVYSYELTESQLRDHFIAGRGIFEADNPYLYTVGQLAPAVHYRFNEASGAPADLLGLRDLTKEGAPTQSDSGGPLVNVSNDGSIQFDGSDDAAKVAEVQPVAQVSAYPMAVYGWLRTPAAPGASDVFSEGGAADESANQGHARVALETDGSSNVTASALFRTDPGSLVTDNIQPASPVLEADVWHFVMFVLNNSTKRKLYVNGALVATETTSRTFPSKIDSFIFGRDSASNFRAGYFSESGVVTADVSDSEALDLYVAAFKARLFTINRYERSIADTISVQDLVALAFGSSMTDTVTLSDAMAVAWKLHMTDTVDVADTIEAVMTFINAVSDTVDVAGTINTVLKAYAEAEDTLSVADAMAARGRFIRSLSDSIETSITINVSGTEYVGLVLNTANMAVSTYRGWDFNSFAEIDGHYIGAGRDGLYELDGADDDGSNIDWEIDFGYMDFGTDQSKRPPEIFYSCRNDGTILFKVTHVREDGSKIENWYQATRTADALAERRIKTKKGAKSQYWRLQILSQAGSSIDLEKIELTPLHLMRKL